MRRDFCINMIDLYCSRLFINSHASIYHRVVWHFHTDCDNAKLFIEKDCQFLSTRVGWLDRCVEVRTLIELTDSIGKIKEREREGKTVICYSWDRGMFLSHVQISIKFEHNLNINGSLFVHIIDCSLSL